MARNISVFLERVFVPGVAVPFGPVNSRAETPPEAARSHPVGGAQCPQFMGFVQFALSIPPQQALCAVLIVRSLQPLLSSYILYTTIVAFLLILLAQFSFLHVRNVIDTIAQPAEARLVAGRSGV